MHHLRLLHKLGQMAALMFLPIWLFVSSFLLIYIYINMSYIYIYINLSLYDFDISLSRLLFGLKKINLPSKFDLPVLLPDLSSEVVVLLVVDGALHWLQNILAFTLLKVSKFDVYTSLVRYECFILTILLRQKNY